MYLYVYIHSNGDNEFLCSGIGFHEFNAYLVPKLQNIMLLKGDYLGNNCIHNFELFEGQSSIAQLAIKSQNHLGDFHFIDYSKTGDIAALIAEDIKDILYLSHMHQPANSPFFEALENRFVYLSHDDNCC